MLVPTATWYIGGHSIKTAAITQRFVIGFAWVSDYSDKIELGSKWFYLVEPVT